LSDDEHAWREQLHRWPQPAASASERRWLLAAVRPSQCERLASWLRSRGHTVRILQRASELPLTIDVIAPDRVGIDRLLDAVAAKRRLNPSEPAILIDAGSAVTVDYLDETHTFRGGTIFPGLRLMAQALHDHTARLPLVNIPTPLPDVPANDTIPAMQTGVFHAVVGGIERIVRLLTQQAASAPHVFITGGDAAMLHPALTFPATLWPTQTLEGILASAEALPS
jgi:type III pantothenate kinase